MKREETFSRPSSVSSPRLSESLKWQARFCFASSPFWISTFIILFYFKSPLPPLKPSRDCDYVTLPIQNSYTERYNFYNTVERRYNEPLYNEVLGITNNFLYLSNSKIYEKEPRNTEQILPVPWPFAISRFHGVTSLCFYTLFLLYVPEKDKFPQAITIKCLVSHRPTDPFFSNS